MSSGAKKPERHLRAGVHDDFNRQTTVNMICTNQGLGAVLPPQMFQDLYDYLYHQADQGGIPLKGTGIVLGVLLLAVHLVALLKSETTQSFLKQFPRNYKWGVILLSIDFAWSMLIMSNMDMGEFFNLRTKFLFVLPVAFVLVLIFVKEFLAVRALGALMLLVSGPVLTAAFLQPPASRVLVPILAYAWIIAGMYFVGMPFLMRDWVNWVTQTTGRWKLATLGGVAYGAVMLVVAVVAW